MSNPEFDGLRRQFCNILRTSANTFRASALVVEQYSNIIEAGGIPSAHDIAQITMQLPQVPNMVPTKSKKKGKDNDGDLNMFEALPSLGDVDSKKRKRAPRKARDPNAPRRPPSAYLLYQNSVRAEVKGKYPDSPYNEILGIIAKQWSELTDEAKKPFHDATAVAKEQYEGDKAKYDAKVATAADASIKALAAVESSSEDSSEDTPPPVVTTSKSTKPKVSLAKSPPKQEKKKAAAVVLAPTSDEDSEGKTGDDSDEDSDQEEEAKRPRKKAKKVKTPPPPAAKKEKKAKEEKGARKK